MGPKVFLDSVFWLMLKDMSCTLACMGIAADDTDAKARARKVRIVASDLGWAASLSRTRLPYAPDYDVWTISNDRGKAVAKVKGIDAAEEVLAAEIQRRLSET